MNDTNSRALNRAADSYYDPDASGLFDQPACEVCSHDPVDCVCKVCPVCTEQGNPNCAINKETVNALRELILDGTVNGKPLPGTVITRGNKGDT